MGFILDLSDANLTLGLPDPKIINQVLKERFSVAQEEGTLSFHDFLQWRRERDDEWYEAWYRENHPEQPVEQSDEFFLPEYE